MQKRYQVFISSTYTDLKEERGLVSQILMQMDCIPAGMELFPATDEEQFDFIKKVIDDSDYYLLIVGGRYGSVTEEGVSYTEKEFDYAVSKGIPVVALLHGSASSIPVAKSELDPTMRARLETFRSRASNGRLVKFWSTADELGGQVAISMIATISRFPRVGWIRGSSAASEDLLREINDLRKENDLLRREAGSVSSVDLSGIELADMDSQFTINGTVWINNFRQPWTARATWKEIFYYISPYLNNATPESVVKNSFHMAILESKSIKASRNILSDQDFQTISVQLRALGLVSITASDVVGVEGAWQLTQKGEALMYQLRVKTK